MDTSLTEWIRLSPARSDSLPCRCLFCNENMRVLLTGLKPGQSVTGFAPPCALTLLVTYGELTLTVEGAELKASDGQMLLLNPGVPFRLTACGHADFLVLCRACPLRQNETAPSLIQSQVLNRN